MEEVQMLTRTLCCQGRHKYNTRSLGHEPSQASFTQFHSSHSDSDTDTDTDGLRHTDGRTDGRTRQFAQLDIELKFTQPV